MLLDHLVSYIVYPPAFGLDISDFTVKFIKFGRHGKTILVDFFGEANLPSGMIIEGEIKKEGELVAFLKKNLIASDGRRVNERFVVATLPEERGFVNIVELPKMSLAEAGKAARWELEGVVPLPVEKLYFDYAVLPSGNLTDRMDLLVTAFPRDIVDSYVRVLSGIGLVPVSLELESQAISRALWDGGEDAFIFVDLGATRTSFMTVVGGNLISTRSTSVISGLHFNKAIADRLKISEQEAGRLKIEVGFSREYNGGAIYEALLPQVSALADELKKEMLFFQEHAKHRHGMTKNISRVILSGGDANLLNLANHLSVSTKKMTEVGNPLGRMFAQGKFYSPFPKKESLKYTSAIGAALRSISL